MFDSYKEPKHYSCYILKFFENGNYVKLWKANKNKNESTKQNLY